MYASDWCSNRTALINQIRGFLLERGVTFPAQTYSLAQKDARSAGRCRAEPDAPAALAAGSAVAGVEAD